MGEKIRIDKWLANMGMGSRNDVKAGIKQGRIKIDGQVVKTAKEKADVETAIVTVDGLEIPYVPYVYLMLNKPEGYISSTEDGAHPTVIELVPEAFWHYELFPVGRLDIDTVGLLILTNDGKMAHQLLAPKKHVPKTYYAEINATVTDKDVKAFQKGITLDDGYKCMPAELVILDNPSHIELTIHEGKFHQVKRMFESVGKSVEFLERIKMGALPLDRSLERGEMRQLTEEEMEWLQEK